MKICVLLPDYSTTDVDYKNYDPARNLKNLRPKEDIVDTIFLNKLTTYKQLKSLTKNGYDIFVNLCEGYLEWEVPSIDVINSLDLLNLPYTGPTAILYDPPKPLMKYVAYTAHVKTPNAIVVSQSDFEPINLQYPLFVKPTKAGDSLGIDNNSLVKNESELQTKLNEILPEYDEVLIEEYIDGREFTVLVVNDASGKTCTAYDAVEYIFPDEIGFKTYAHKTSSLHTDANKICDDEMLNNQLKDAAKKIFTAFDGKGYARLDFRLNEKNKLFFLEINFTCSVFYEDGYEGSADYILNNVPNGKQQFLHKIIEEGIERYKLKQKKYAINGNSIAGFGIFAVQNISLNEVIFKGEEIAQRIVTKKYVEQNWDNDAKENFKHYAYPISDEVYILWDENPNNWAPQNHSCDPNTAYKGLNVIAIKDIKLNEELTLDYAQFLNENIEPFTCNCGAVNCKGIVKGIIGNSITTRQKI